MTRVAVVSDTHLPRRGRALPQRLLDECAAADLILHAGDVVAPEVLFELEAYGEVLAVRGNCDGDDLRQLPLERVVEIGGARIGMIHDSGRGEGRAARLARRFDGCRAVVFGHSHVPLVEESAGILLVNPGSPTDPRGQPAPTMAVLDVAAGAVRAALVDVSAPTP